MAVPELDPLKESSEATIAVAEPPTKTEQRGGAKTAKGKTKPRNAPNYHVIIWNDDVHTYEYVIELLMRLFAHPLETAFEITKQVDKAGKGVAYTCHQELAELKRDQILAYGADWRMAESNCSIRATIEPAPD